MFNHRYLVELILEDVAILGLVNVSEEFACWWKFLGRVCVIPMRQKVLRQFRVRDWRHMALLMVGHCCLTSPAGSFAVD